MTTLPTITLYDDTYYVDKRLRQLRNTKDPNDFIDFDDFETSLKVAVISIRHAGGEELHKDLYEQLMRHARAYDQALGNTPSITNEQPVQPPPSPLKRKKRSRRLLPGAPAGVHTRWRFSSMPTRSPSSRTPFSLCKLLGLPATTRPPFHPHSCFTFTAEMA